MKNNYMGPSQNLIDSDFGLEDDSLKDDSIPVTSMSGPDKTVNNVWRGGRMAKRHNIDSEPKQVELDDWLMPEWE